MKIYIQNGSRNMTISLPTRMIFSKTSAKLAIRMGKKYAGNQDGEEALLRIPDEALVPVCAEICRIKKARGGWDLIEVESAGGEVVKITL